MAVSAVRAGGHRRAWVTLAVCIGALLAIVLAGYLLSGPAADINPDDSLQAPGLEHPLGTDELGRDVAARVLVASRLSLGISIVATLIGAAVGILIGAIPAVAGRHVGRLVAAAINLALAFPALLLALFVAAVVGAGTDSSVLAIALAFVPAFARLTQTLAASISQADYIAAARLLGVGPFRILLRHVIPNIAGPLLVTAMIGVSGALLVLSGLSFLGLGVEPPLYDWGTLLNQGFNRIYISPASSLAPAAAIVLAGLIFSLIGEALAVLLGVRRADGLRAAGPAVEQAGTQRQEQGEPHLLSIARLRVEVPGNDRGNIAVVRDVSFALAPGERVGIVGESGSGKTMTALAVARLLDPRYEVTADRLTFLGTSLLGDDGSDARLRSLLGTSMAVVFQDPLGSFNPVLRVGGQLAEVATEHAGLSHREAHARAVDRMKSVGIASADAKARAYPHQFSGGMLQRSMIGMGLMVEPRLIIADEPTTALDATVQQQVLRLLDDVCDRTGAGLLLISHDLAVVAQTCRRVLVMYAGRIVEDLTVDQLRAGPAHPYTRALLSSILEMTADRSSPLPTIAGRPPELTMRSAGCAFAPRCARATVRCSEALPDMRPLAGDHRVACWNPLTGPTPADAKSLEGAA